MRSIFARRRFVWRAFIRGTSLKKQWLGFVLFFLVPVIIVLWFVGAFSGATTEFTERGPYHYAYVAHTGDFSKLPDKQDEVYGRLKSAGIHAGPPITLLYSDPRVTPKDERQARTGFIIPADAKTPEGLQVDEVPSRAVLVVSVKANPLIAPSKAYKALIDYLKANNMQLTLPTVEIYQDGVLSVEMPM